MVTSRGMSRREGLALATTFLMILLLAVMASGIVSMVMEEGTLSANRVEMARAESIADAAESFAIRKMNRTSGWDTWSGVEDKDFAGGSFSVEVTSVSSDEKKLQCEGVFGRSAAVRQRFVRRGPLAAEGAVSAYISDNRLLVSQANFFVMTTRFDNPSSDGQGAGQGDRVYIRVSGIELHPDRTNTIQLERLDGSTSLPELWKPDAFRYDADNDWLEAVFRLPEADNGGKEWKDCFVNLEVEIETTRVSGLDYVPDSRQEKDDTHRDDVRCDIRNNTGQTVVLTAMIASWDEPEAYYQKININIRGGENYQAVWVYDDERAESGEKVVFNQGKTVSIPDGASFRLHILNFRSTRTGSAQKRDMRDTSFTITFFAGEIQYPETTVLVFGESGESSAFTLLQAIHIGMPQPVARIYETSAARGEEGEGLRRWQLSQGQTYFLRVWTERLSGALKAGEGKLKLLDLFGDEEYSNADAFSAVGGGRYDADITIPVSGQDPPEGWSDVPTGGWDYVLRIEMEDLAGENFCYSSAVRIAQ